MFWLLPVSVIFVLGLWYMAFVTLKHTSAVPNVLRDLMNKGCWILPNGCSRTQVITRVSVFILLTWSTVVMGLHIEPFLCLGDKPCLLRVCTYFNAMLHSVCWCCWGVLHLCSLGCWSVTFFSHSIIAFSMVSSFAFWRILTDFCCKFIFSWKIIIVYICGIQIVFQYINNGAW